LGKGTGVFERVKGLKWPILAEIYFLTFFILPFLFGKNGMQKWIETWRFYLCDPTANT
jgi:hypothetical protein